MEKHDDTAMRTLICDAIKDETQIQTLSTFIAARLPVLTPVLSLPCHAPEDTLTVLTRRYIEYLPAQLSTLRHALLALKVEAHYARAFTVTDDFLMSNAQCEQSISLVDLVGKAYFGHRVVEEIYDRIAMHVKNFRPSMDMSLSNIVIHTLLGDPFGNSLDAAVQSSIAGTPSRHSPEPIAESVLRQALVHSTPQEERFCLARSLGISITGW